MAQSLERRCLIPLLDRRAGSGRGIVQGSQVQHHRPATFLPTDWHIEEEPDGAVTAWFSDHDPLKLERAFRANAAPRR